MVSLSPAQPGAEQRVTASDLVRHFGVWQERATRAPVYILHRGRPRLVLTSLDVMDALCTPHFAAASADTSGDTLLDVVETIMLVTDRDLVITGASRGARRYFGAAASAGQPITGCAAPGDTTLPATVRRVLASGETETIECRSPRVADRRLACTVIATPEGCVVQIADTTTTEEGQRWRERHEALSAALAATRSAAVSLNLRGRIEEPTPALAALTGATLDALAAARLVSLIAVADRTRVGDALEAVIEQGAAMSLSASLLVGGAAISPSTIGLVPLTAGGRITGVSAVIVPNDGRA
ncbi:hypothetical protein [Sphingomonas sp. TZW2008]|uniref:hypothetical protein n=1 Tax=Sphingomonas sp. TZW2008 TaxID=1917973 RepID=UPI000A26BEF8|nr:hypothetical protein [Sphingomonas sp. TZW2008]